MTRALKVELLHLPDCPHVERARELLRSCLGELGLTTIRVEVRSGSYPSPSIIVNGTDVMGAPPYEAASCRLDVPSRERVNERAQRVQTMILNARLQSYLPSLGLWRNPVNVRTTRSGAGDETRRSDNLLNT